MSENIHSFADQRGELRLISHFTPCRPLFFSSLRRLSQTKRYNRMLFMIDTCQANTMYSKFYSPNILATGSSELGEPSFSVSCVPFLSQASTIDRHD